MKQLLNIILLCGLSLTISAQDWSYVKTRTMTNAGGTTYLDHFDYDNGLGQTHQQIDVNFTPNHNNLVTLIEYDDYRRPAQVWLPVEMSGSGVMNDNTVKSTATTFYSNSMPYTKNIYEQSPLERIKQRYLPGQEWYNAGKSQQTDWYTNTSSNPEGNALVLTMNQSTLSFSSTSQKYWIEKTTDEDDRKTITFTDLCGQVAAVRNYDSTPLTTYYAYDDFGDLRYVLPPEVADYYEGNPSQSLSPTSTLMEQYGYEYRYDNRHNCIYKRLPGCDPIYYIYDKAGHCIFSQDGVQRIAGKWSFNIPDAFGRTVMTGVFTGSIDYTTEPLRNTVFMATRSNGNMNLHGYIFSGTTPINNFSYGYLEIYTVQYYDDYSFIGNTGTFSTLNYSTPPSSDYGSRGLTAPKNMPTGSMTGRLTSTGVNGYDYATIFYDDRGRVIQTKTTNYMGGYDYEYTGYDYTGNVLKRQHVHNKSGGSTQTETYTYTYDQAGRLITTKHKLNSNSEVTLHEIGYDAVGRLTSRSNGAVATTSYDYNVRSWLKNITTGSLFSETLYYNDSYGGNTLQYAGNISAIKWTADTKTRGYKFTYDKFSRLLKADYLENGSTNSNYNTEYTYDMMGNFLTLKRNGMTSTGNYGIIDNLTFTYNGNQVTKIEDSENNLTYNGAFNFNDSTNISDDYSYDKNGNLTKDSNKKIFSIQYNSLNLPSKINYSDGKTMDYVYSGTGEKKSVTYNVLMAGGNYTYCGNFIYYNGNLSQILFDGGYVGISGSTPTYHYYLKDHLGNNRMVVNASGVVKQVNHYYPFGGLFGESTGGGYQDFKYNDKEFNRLIGLDWYDYGARHMTPDAGRFTTIDPLSEKYYSISPYVYCGNNPMNIIDPSGMDWYRDADGHLQWNSDLTEDNAGDLLHEGESYLSYSSDGRVYATDADGRFFYGDREGNLSQFLMPEITITGYRNPALHNSLAYSLMGFRGVTDSGDYGPWSPDAMSIEGGFNIQLGSLSYSYGLGLISGDNESALYFNFSSGFAQGLRFNIGGYLSLDFYNINRDKLPVGSGIGLYENNAMNWGFALGPVGFNYGYGTNSGYNNDLYKSYGIFMGTGVGASFGPSQSKYLIKK